MKRARNSLLAGLGFLVAFAAVGTLVGDAAAKPEPTDPNKPQPAAKRPETDGAVATIKLAHDLAHWGRQSENPTALALAARVLGTVRTRPLKQQAARKTTERRKSEAPTRTHKPHVTPQSLLAEAEDLCRGNKELLAAVRTIAKMDMPKARSPVGGATRHADMVMRYDTDVYKLVFTGGEAAEMAILGSGDTNLDLYVYDAKEQLVASDTDGADRCYVQWVPKSTGPFTVKIRNRGGQPNHYTLVTN